MSHHARRPIRRGLFNVSLLLALLLAGFAGLTSLTRPTEAVNAAPNPKAEKFLPSTPNTPTQTATPSPTPTPTTNCPTSRWSAEGNANDSNGLNPGSLKNGATFAPGEAGQAFSLDGVGAYVEAAINTAEMNSPISFTWEAWVNPNSLANNPVVFSKEAGVFNRAGLQIDLNGSLCSYMNSGTCAAISAPGVVATCGFTKVTLLYDGSTHSLVTYVNGSQVSSATVAEPYNNSAAFNIGWSPFGSGNTHFPGRIDEVTFSSCAVRPTASQSAVTGCGPTPTPTPAPSGFVIGDLNAVVGEQVTFWGAEWAKKNSLSGGSAPASFKGFANSSSPNPANCGGTWSSDPGNSFGPPSSIPGFITVIVSSSTTKSGNVISGYIPSLAIVKTDPGYDPNPGHAGTGTVVAIICQPPP